MKRKLMLFALIALLTCGMTSSAQATVVPASGIGQIGYEAIVLCQSLTVRETWNASSRTVMTLKAGDVFSFQNYTNGFLDCFPSENGGRAGWVKADYVIVNPARYNTDAATPVRAWNSEHAYQIALLERGGVYPILKTEGEWLCIGLRGAAGWIHDPQAAAEARAAAFYPADLAYLTQAELTTPDGARHALADPAALTKLGNLLSDCHVVTPTGCPFDATLTLTLVDGRTQTLQMATDSCNVFRIEGQEDSACYKYGASDSPDPVQDSSGNQSAAFWALFGLRNDQLH